MTVARLPRCPIYTTTNYRDARGPYVTSVQQCVLDDRHPGQHLAPPIRPDDTLDSPA